MGPVSMSNPRPVDVEPELDDAAPADPRGGI
jgi:hypothetical protein